jgi:hypothetical protein
VGPTEETVRMWCLTGLEAGWALQRRQFECGASLDWRLSGPYRGDGSNVVPHWTGGWVGPLQRRRFERRALLSPYPSHDPATERTPI